ncbi:uncharacterized protein BXZ73DRAFT_77301 [Epithele typhae]|uniref:uncharacterized protein n=1 Tax=Epithele typhae TaxID=378194 RepID=UPI002007E8FB|nr:uncharacterized protein BXZ73DRAFT_77301 [Epithele typhae]KAH9933134.1 hypothetical protein BXZ73DRAFT_77301 [Epithele typhae]
MSQESLPSDTVHPIEPEVNVDRLCTEITVSYLNGQLNLNHLAAVRRIEEYASSTPSDEIRRTFAWKKYASRGRHSVSFEFGMPQLSFVCDHDALLELTLLEAKFRVSTERRTLVGNDSKVGDYESRIHLLVFDLEHAKHVEWEGVDQEHAKEADLERHFLLYLRYLQAGGHHVLFFPPEFDEDDLRPNINFSLTTDSDSVITLDSILGVSTAAINNYLSLMWFTCVFMARARGEANQMVWDDRTFLAGFKSWFIAPNRHSDWHFSVRFGKPQVRILCAREIILTFNLSEVTFYSHEEHPDPATRNKEPDYKGWKLSLLLEVDVSKTDVKVNTNSIHYGELFSTYEYLKEEHKQAHAEFIRFFVAQYIEVIRRTKLQYLYRCLIEEHSLIHRRTEADGSWWMLEFGARAGAGALDSMIRGTNMGGFDLVMAISQTSITNQIRARFQKAREIFSVWSGDQAQIEVKMITVSLLPKSRAIVTFTVTTASMGSELLNDDLELEEVPGGPHNIGECRLAFEVELKSCAHDMLPNPDYTDRPYYVPVIGAHYEHIYLDLKSAEPIPERSTFEEGAPIDEVGKRVQLTLIHHQRRPGPDPPEAATEQILFVLGMTGGAGFPRREYFKPSPNWIVHSSTGFSHGTFAVNKLIFRKRLFALLARVNALTTLVSVSATAQNSRDGASVVELWARHPEYRDKECAWLTGDGTDGSTRKSMSGSSTQNELLMPDLAQLSKGSFEVKMSGTTSLRIFSDERNNSWSTESSLVWEITISIKTQSRGAVKVEILGADNIKQSAPKTSNLNVVAGDDVRDAYAILRANLPRADEFTAVGKELRELEGAWKYYYPAANPFTLCSPTFNHSGDLLFELRRSAAPAATPNGRGPWTPSSGSGSPGSARSHSPAPGSATTSSPSGSSSPGGGPARHPHRPGSPAGHRAPDLRRPGSPAGRARSPAPSRSSSPAPGQQRGRAGAGPTGGPGLGARAQTPTRDASRVRPPLGRQTTATGAPPTGTGGALPGSERTERTQRTERTEGVKEALRRFRRSQVYEPSVAGRTPSLGYSQDESYYGG